MKGDFVDMTTTLSHKTIKSTRKPCQCFGCGRLCGPAREMLEIALNASASETERSMAANTLVEIISGAKPC
jgi:hypothetical protein